MAEDENKETGKETEKAEFSDEDINVLREVVAEKKARRNDGEAEAGTEVKDEKVDPVKEKFDNEVKAIQSAVNR